MLADEPECVVYCAMGDNRTPEAMEDVRRILAAGINVVGSAPVVLQFPWQVMPDKYITRMEEAAQQEIRVYSSPESIRGSPTT